MYPRPLLLGTHHSAQTTPGPCVSPRWSLRLWQALAHQPLDTLIDTLTDQKRALSEASRKCLLADTHMNSSGKLQFYREKVPDCHGPLLSQESKKSKKRAFEQSEQEQSAPQSAKQKCMCLAVEDWDLLNSYWLIHTVNLSPHLSTWGGETADDFLLVWIYLWH